MKKFNEEKFIKVLQEAEGDILVRDVCRKHQITEQTFYRWRNISGSMTVLEVRRLKELEHDNAQLKQIVTDLTLENRNLRDVNQKAVRLSERRRIVDIVKSRYPVSER